jgi:tRNA1(Val) A37 N6-methylase TrmN6
VQIKGDSLLNSAPDGVQLFVRIGDWRIFQRIGGHRWTTDDLVTAWVAGKTVRDRALDGSCSSSSSGSGSALDLGCGNGSVPLMMAWQFPSMFCVGMKARMEAVELAKRSVAYNCGSDDIRVRVVNIDFRLIYHKKHSNSTRPPWTSLRTPYFVCLQRLSALACIRKQYNHTLSDD